MNELEKSRLDDFKKYWHIRLLQKYAIISNIITIYIIKRLKFGNNGNYEN